MYYWFEKVNLKFMKWLQCAECEGAALSNLKLLDTTFTHFFCLFKHGCSHSSRALATYIEKYLKMSMMCIPFSL